MEVSRLSSDLVSLEKMMLYSVVETLVAGGDPSGCSEIYCLFSIGVEKGTTWINWSKSTFYKKIYLHSSRGDVCEGHEMIPAYLKLNMQMCDNKPTSMIVEFM